MGRANSFPAAIRTILGLKNGVEQLDVGVLEILHPLKDQTEAGHRPVDSFEDYRRKHRDPRASDLAGPRDPEGSCHY